MSDKTTAISKVASPPAPPGNATTNAAAADDLSETSSQCSSSSSSSSAWNIIKNPSSGRTRISQACDRCRARKIKCSGKSETNPRCTNCEKDGFQCVVSDKLTRNSFPKGYTKNLEKKLLEVELDRNKLSLELKEARQKLAEFQKGGVKKELDREVVKEIPREQDKLKAETPVTHAPSLPSSLLSTFKADDNGLLILDQFMVLPFNAFLQKLQIHSFNGYELVSDTDKSKKRRIRTGSTSGQGHMGGTSDESSVSDEPYGDSKDPEMKVYLNYHMNLNRYLNLVLYKLILPCFSAGASENKGRFASSTSGKNLDHLIWLFFNVYNKLIPILDFELFYNDYLTFINKYTIKNSTYIDHGETKKRYYEFSTKEQDLMVRLILILKFTMAEPKGSNLSSIPDRRSFNQLEESLKLINLKNLKLLFGNIDFALDLTMDKFEISLLLFYYLIKFENYNVCPSSQTSTNESKFKVNFLRDVAQLCFSIKDALHLNRDPRHLSLAKKPATNEQIINIQRLKLYWDFRILVGLTESYLNIDLDRITPETELAEMQSQNLESIRFVSPDIEATFQLVNLLKITPKHVLELCVKNDTEELEKFDENLKIWVDSVDSLQNDDNISVINRLKTYYHYFKVLIHLNGSRHELKLACTSLIDTAYDIIFSGKNSEVSLENAEGLSLHSFNFHLLCMISIITLGNSGDRSRELGIKLLKISQLYQLLVAVKDVEPIICNLTKYIADNVTLSTSGDSLPQEGLALFSYSMSPSSSLFDRKGPSSVHEQQQQRQQGPDSQMPFDLSAFKMSSDSRFMIEREIPYKRRKNDSPTSSLSAISSRESSSASSKLLSISSSDTSVTPVPSLFPSATASICNDSPAAKKRRSPYSNGGRMSQHAELSRSELSHAMRFRSMSMDATALPTDKDAPDVAFSRSQSECGVNNPEPTSLANSNSSTSSIPQAFSSLFNEINLNMDLNDFKEDEEESKVFGFGAGKVKSSLSTIPSETNLEASMYDASCLISHEIPRMEGESPKEKTLFRDNDDLNRLKKRVMNMRASMLS